ncbi:MAG: hypothetical protein DME43_06725 [Verrucomicrobia bacterium]|nr:MAG: hypothetical protein DME43_06725 [Verrucomicrobiota bacterium]
MGRRRCQGETFPLPSGVAGVTRHWGLFPHRHQAIYQTRLKTRRNGGFRISRIPQKKDSGSARQGETANTETCNYPNRLNLTHLTAAFSGPFEISRVFAKKFWPL